MRLLYNIGICLYTLGVHLAAPFHKKAALWVKGRRGIFKRIEQISRGDEKLIWFHTASLGEFEQGRPVMEALRKARPDVKILLTFFSPSGYEIRKNYAGADYVFYLPADTPRNARRFIKYFRPTAVVFVKYEFWYNYLSEMYKNHIPVYLISAIFRQSQPFFKSWGSLHRKMLGYFNCLFVQDEVSVSLLRSVGIEQTELAGDTRFDRVKQIADAAERIAKVEEFLAGSPAVVCGSTWPPDEDILFAYINRYSGAYKWIFAPHEIGEGHIKSILEKCEKKVVRFSDAEHISADADVLIIDCIGLLSRIYRYGQVSYIGGGFGVGIHNTLEAAVYGIPVIFGPKYHKFNEAVNLIRQGGGFSVRDGSELKELLDTLLTTPPIREAAGQQALNYVNSQLGATEKIMERITIL